MYQGGELWTQYEVNLGGLVDVYVVIEMTVYYWCYVICCVCMCGLGVCMLVCVDYSSIIVRSARRE